jgi:hypothetical protein
MQVQNSGLVGSFFYNFDKTQLYHVESQVGPSHYLVACYEGIFKPSKKVWPITRICGFDLFPNKEAAIAAMDGAR